VSRLPRIVIDTNVLIYMLKAEAFERTGPEEERPSIERARALLIRLRNGQTAFRPVLPSTAIAEVLQKHEASDHAEILRLFLRHFEILPLDAAGASIAAELMRKAGLPGGAQRDCVRTDAFMLGIAIAHKAAAVMSTDENLPKLADGRIQILGLPEAAAQQDFDFPEPEE
jgi:predicted nucleic acid-binding protein